MSLTSPVKSHPYDNKQLNNNSGYDLPKKKGKGCFFYGCLTSIFLFIVLSILTFFAGRYVYNNFVTQYTESNPMLLENLDLSDEEISSTIKKLNDFNDKIAIPEEPYSIELNTKELNILLNYHPYMKYPSMDIRAELNDLVNAKIRYKLDDSTFVNIKTKFKIGVQNDELVLDIKDLNVSGKSFNEDVSSSKSKISDHEKLAEAFKNIESVTISGDSLVVTKK